MTTPNAAAIQVTRIGTETINVPIIGTASLIVHRWSEKAKAQMLATQQGQKAVKKIRNPQEDYESSLYRTDTGYGFPLLAFKQATVGAARFFDKSVTMKLIQQAIFMTGVPSADRSELLTPITGEPKMREDMVRVGMGGTDLRYRGEFLDWSAVLCITYVTSTISRDSVLSLVDAGGQFVGVGEWRPDRKGQNGTYTIDPNRKVEVAR
jgi:hypothetical protein